MPAKSLEKRKKCKNRLLLERRWVARIEGKTFNTLFLSAPHLNSVNIDHPVYSRWNILEG